MLPALQCLGQHCQLGIYSIAVCHTCGCSLCHGMPLASKYLGSFPAPVGPISGAAGRQDGSMHSNFAGALSIQCKVCAQCSAFLHKGSGTPDAKRSCAQEWRAHLTGQYHDRLIYWHMRWFSRLRVRGVLCIIIDSMDKAKLPFPQYQWRKPKSLDRLRRPRMVVTCAWAHGFCCDFYVGHDELQPHGASAFCEVLSRTIQHIMGIAAGLSSAT
jgi:hypothetical protein